MKKLIKNILSAAVTMYFAGILFYCLVAGAPGAGGGIAIYVVMAAGFSVILPIFVCACIHYVLYLQKKLEQLEKKEKEQPQGY